MFKLYATSKKLFREGGFNRRKFLTNPKCLQEKIDFHESPNPDDSSPQDDQTSETTLGISQPLKMEEHKVLGVPWNPESDQLMFDVSDLAKAAIDLKPTKRNLVSLIGRFYDPLGFLSPVIIRFKILFQKLCQCKSDWDEIIVSELMEEWNNLVTDLNEAQPISLPRSYFYNVAGPITSATLCGFCDASTKAFAAVIYLLRSENKSVV